MAKNWEYNKESMTLIRNYTEKVIDEVTKEKVDVEVCASLGMRLLDLFGNWESLDEVQQAVVINGLKQKLDDATARSKDEKLTEEEKREVQKTLWLRISEERKWNTEGKEKAERGPSVPLKTVVPALQEAGFGVEVIAKMLNKSLEVVQRFVETGEEEVSE